MALDLSEVPTQTLLESVEQVAKNHPNFRESHLLLLSIVDELGNRVQRYESSE